MNIVKNIIHRATKKDSLTLLILPYDGIYEQLFPQHIVWTNQQLSIYEWENRPTPTYNFAYFNADNKNISIPEYLCIDSIIVHDTTKQYEIGQKIAYMYQCPIFIVIHQKPKNKWERYNFSPCGKTVYCSQDLANSWNETNGTIITYPTNNEQEFLNKWENILR